MCRESGKSCGPLGPPDGPGVEGSDFVLYVSGITTERCGQENIVAYAAYCQLEAELDRWAGATHVVGMLSHSSYTFQRVFPKVRLGDVSWLIVFIMSH